MKQLLIACVVGLIASGLFLWAGAWWWALGVFVGVVCVVFFVLALCWAAGRE